MSKMTERVENAKKGIFPEGAIVSSAVSPRMIEELGSDISMSVLDEDPIDEKRIAEASGNEFILSRYRVKLQSGRTGLQTLSPDTFAFEGFSLGNECVFSFAIEENANNGRKYVIVTDVKSK